MEKVQRLDGCRRISIHGSLFVRLLYKYILLRYSLVFTKVNSKEEDYGSPEP